jgi:hypothetical protein
MNQWRHLSRVWNAESAGNAKIKNRIYSKECRVNFLL